MVLPLGAPGSDQEVQRIRKRDGHPLVERLFPVRFVPLVCGALPE